MLDTLVKINGFTIQFDYPNFTAELLDASINGPVSVAIYKQYDEESDRDFYNRVVETVQRNYLNYVD